MAGEIPLTVTLDIQTHTEWCETDADGSACVGCGDRIYLNPAHEVVLLDQRNHVLARSNSKVCNSCMQEHLEPDDAGEEWKNGS